MGGIEPMKAQTRLAAMFSPLHGYRGAETNMSDLCIYLRHQPLCLKAEAVNLIMVSRMERGEAPGKGNKAARREAVARSFDFTDDLPLSPFDVDRLAEEWQNRRLVAPLKNYHDK